MSDQPAMESLSVDQAADQIGAMFDPEPVVGQNEEEVTADVEATELEGEELEGEEVEAELGEDVPDEPEEVEAEQEAIETLTELSEALDVDMKDLMANMTTTVKVDGEEISVTLQEAFDGYQKDTDYRNKTTELASNRRDFEQQSSQARQRLESDYLQAGQLMNALQSAVVPVLDPQQMEALKAQDPSSYLIAKQEHQERLQQFNQLRQSAANDFARNTEALNQQKDATRQEALRYAIAELPKRIPGWGDETKNAIDDYLSGDAYGYTQEELSQVIDPRLIELAHKARLYDEQSKQVDIAKKKVKTLPKIQRPGKSSPRKASGSVQKARSRLKQSGRYQDAAALINVD